MRMRFLMLMLAFTLMAAPAFAQQATVTLFSTGTDGVYSGSVDAHASLPFGIDAAGYFDVNDVDGASREDARIVATRALVRGVLVAYEFRANEDDAPNRFGVGYRLGAGINAIYFPYGIDFDTNTIDDDGHTVQVNGSRVLGDWRVGGKLDVTQRNDATRYWGEASAAFDVVPGVAFVGEYRARPVGDGVFTHNRSVWFGVAVSVLK